MSVLKLIMLEYILICW